MLVNFAGLITSLSSPGLVSLSICCLICFSLHLLFSCCFFRAEEVSQMCVTFTGRESKASRCLTTNQSEKEVINIDESSLNHFGVLLTSHSPYHVESVGLCSPDLTFSLLLAITELREKNVTNGQSRIGNFKLTRDRLTRDTSIQDGKSLAQ